MAKTKGYVYFTIVTEDKNLDISDFNKYISLKPTKFMKKYERGKIPKSTNWDYSSGDLVNPYYFEEIEKLIKILTPHTEEFKLFKLHNPTCVLRLVVVIFLGDETPGLNFSENTINFINDLGGSIDCDIYNRK